MQKNYTFLILIWIMLYLLYNILNNEYKNYKDEKITENFSVDKKIILEKIKDRKEEFAYKNTKAYNDRINKSSMKWLNSWEEMLQVVEENNYNKYNNDLDVIIKKPEKREEYIYDWMSIFQKWIYFIFEKDVRD